MNIYWYSVGTTQWTILASTVEETRGAALTTETRPALMVLPRNFEVANTTLAEYMTEFGSCEMFIDKYIHQVEKNHLYIEHTLQPAYTAGLYVIFQNAMVLSQLPSNTSVYNDKTSLSFSGNSQDIGGWCLRRNPGEAGRRFFLKYSSASTVVEAITDHGKFPPFLIQMHLRDCTTANAPEPPLDSLRIGSVVLVDKVSPTEEYFVGENDHTGAGAPDV